MKQNRAKQQKRTVKNEREWDKAEKSRIYETRTKQKKKEQNEKEEKLSEEERK